MNTQGKCPAFTLYFQKTPDDGKWIDAWAAIGGLAYRSRKVQWRREHGKKGGKALLDYHKSGIYIDTIEQPRVAVFIGDEVEVEAVGKNGKTGCGA